MSSKRYQADDGYGTRWDPGTPKKDGAQRVAIATSVSANQKFTLEEGTWYWFYTPTALDVHYALDTSALSDVDRTLNLPLPAGVCQPVFSGKNTHGAIRADSTTSGYFWVGKIEGGDQLD